MSDLFQDRLKKLRGDRNKAQFSRFLGIPPPMYHRYEEGQIPNTDNLRVIAERCKVSVDWLLTGREGVSHTRTRSWQTDGEGQTHNLVVRESGNPDIPLPSEFVCQACPVKDAEIAFLRSALTSALERIPKA